jgi:hypothetical protein
MIKTVDAFRIAASVTIALSAIAMTGLTAAAQGPTEWSAPERIPGYDDTAWTPYLVTDQNRTVHAFNSVLIEGLRVIVYSQWTLEQGWTEPVDIILPVLKSGAWIEGVFLDQKGVVHLVFYSGDELQANIYYSRAPLAQAGSARAWSTPELIGERALKVQEAALVGDSQDRLFALLSAEPGGVRGLYATHSTDGGATWSEPSAIYLTYSDQLWPVFLKMYADRRDGIHAVWAAANESGNSESVYYAAFDPDQDAWREPVKLAHASGREVDMPSIIEYEDVFFVIYHDFGADAITRFMLRSRDAGRTWTNDGRLFQHVGSNGPASMVVDSSNVLYMFFGNRVSTGSGITYGMWCSVWQGDRWGVPEAIVSGPIRDDFAPSTANAVVTQGNVILLTWMNEPGRIDMGYGGTFYSHTVLDAPELPVAAVPTSVTPTLTSASEPQATASTRSPSPVMRHSQSDSTAWPLSGPALPLILSIIPVALLLLAAIVFQRSMHRSRRR